MISVPKKAVSKSVRRSRIKRLVREAMRMLKIDPQADTGWRFSVKRNPAESISMQEVALAIKELVNQKSGN
jgi:ribonuclease P protein component